MPTVLYPCMRHFADLLKRRIGQLGFRISDWSFSHTLIIKLAENFLLVLISFKTVSVCVRIGLLRFGIELVR